MQPSPPPVPPFQPTWASLLGTRAVSTCPSMAPSHILGPALGLQRLRALLTEMATDPKRKGNHPSRSPAGGCPPTFPPQAPPPWSLAQPPTAPTNLVPKLKGQGPRPLPLSTTGRTAGDRAPHPAGTRPPGGLSWPRLPGAHSRRSLNGAGTAQGPRPPLDAEEGAAGVLPGLALPQGG